MEMECQAEDGTSMKTTESDIQETHNQRLNLGLTSAYVSFSLTHNLSIMPGSSKQLPNPTHSVSRCL